MKAYALIAAFLCITAMAAESTIQLPKPQIPGKSNLQELLQNRQSTRVFDDEPLSEHSSQTSSGPHTESTVTTAS